MRRRRLARSAAGLAASLILAGGCGTPSREGAPAEGSPPEGAPRLVVLIVADQMRYADLERFGPLFTGGLRRLLDDSASFTDAHHDYAVTTTAPGHATLATGLFPSRHGIVNNSWVERGRRKRTYSVEDPRDDRSPRRLLAPTLGDWLKSSFRSSRVFAASGKDRSAILLGGHHADGVFWFDCEKGAFISSSFYPAEPPWLTEFNQRHQAAMYFGEAWEPLPETVRELADPDRAAALGIEELDRGVFPRSFPHPIGGLAFAPQEDYYEGICDSPQSDALLARMAVVMIEAEGLGADAYPDLLALSFSAVDAVGHAHGPNSPEILDALLRLDRSIGEVLEVLDRRVGRQHLLVALSSDHGVVPFPEYQRRHGLPGRRLDAGTILCFQQAGGRLSRRLGLGTWLSPSGSIVEETLAASGRSRAEVEQAARREIESCPGVARVWTRSELASGSAATDPVGRLFAHSFFPGRSADLQVQFEEYFLPRTLDGTTHGSPYDYDTHVPWLLRPPTGAGRRIEQPVYTVDVSPTLAALVGIALPAGLDGVDRSRLLSPR